MSRSSTKRLTKRLRLESLEARQLLDGTGLIADSATLVAADDTVRVSPGVAGAYLDVLANDPIAQADSSTKIISLGKTRRNDARVSISDDGTHLVYAAPDAPYFSDHFTYTIEDKHGNRAEATVRIVLDNRPLERSDWGINTGTDRLTALEGNKAQTFRVLTNDKIRRSNASTINFNDGKIIEVSRPSLGGKVEIVQNGTSLSYQPAARTAGEEQLLYKVVNWQGILGTFDVTIDIQNNYRVDSNSPLFINAGTGSHTIRPQLGRAVGQPSEYSPKIEQIETPSYTGDVTISKQRQSLQYQPAEGFQGEFEIRYKVRYGEAEWQVVDASLKVLVGTRFLAFEDRFQVFTNSENNQLKPLANDPVWEANHIGGSQFHHSINRQAMNLRIAYVHRGSHGGRMEISDDGQTLSYTPAEGFRGEETFRYLLRDTNRGARDWGEITIAVTNEVSVNSGLLPQFGGREELEQLLLERAITQYKHQFGKVSHHSSGVFVANPLIDVIDGRFIDFDSNVVFAADQPSANAGLTNTQADNHSSTNTQVAEVDEADIVETDGRYLYTFSNGKLVIVDVQDPADPQLVSFTELDGNPSEMYLQGDRLTLIDRGSNFHYFGHNEPTRSASLTVLDISNRAEPKVLERTEIDGTISSSRAIGDRVYIIVSKRLRLPTIESTSLGSINEGTFVPTESNVASLSIADNYYPLTPTSYGLIQYESFDAYVHRVRETLVEDTLPSYRTYNAAGELIDSGLFNSPEEVYKLNDEAHVIQSLVTFDTGDEAPGPSAATSLMVDSTSVVYLSQAAAYLFHSDNSVTSIHKLTLEENGTTTLAAAGNVDGLLLNQFSADEHEGRLRVATTTGWGRNSSSNVFILEQVGESLEVVGSVTGIAPTERIYSVRFLGERAWVVTFRQIDPLFALDLSDPTNPTIEGELKIPGFSDYLHPVSEDYLIGVGSTGAGWRGSPQVSLFYVGDLTTPERVGLWTYEGNTNVTTEVSRDHHAFSYFVDQGIFTLPISGSERVGVDLNGDGQFEHYETQIHSEMLAFQITTEEDGNGTLQPIAAISHPTAARRSVRIDEALLTLSEETLLVHNFDNFEEEIARLHLGSRAVDDVFTLLEDSRANRLDVLANDLPDAANTRSAIKSVTPPQESRRISWYSSATSLAGDDPVGEVTIVGEGTALSFTPKKDFFGTATFEYTITDPLRGDQTATVTVIVENTPDDPVANDDSITITTSSTPTKINVLANDENVDADSHQSRYLYNIPRTDSEIVLMPFDPNQRLFIDTNLASDVWYPLNVKDLTITEVSPTTGGGTVEISRFSQTLEYTPAPGFTGTDTFTYQITNRAGLTSEATVTVTVEAEASKNNTVAGSNGQGFDPLEANVFYGPFAPDGRIEELPLVTGVTLTSGS